MSAFLKFMELELGELNTSEFQEPETELAEGDHVAGDMTDYMKRLWTLHSQYRKNADYAAVGAKHGGDAGRAAELCMKADMLYDLFWVDITDELHLWDKPKVGVRRGWKVVWGEDAQTIGNLLSNLFGG